ncbi:MAG: hypothetical protein ACLGSA_11225 [Acidobacteriota bacterium]
MSSTAASPVIRLALLAALLLVGLPGCAKLSASHLQLKPWQDGGNQKLYAKFMHFDFQTLPHDKAFQVKGTAWPIKENIPVWADTVENLSISAYLCDEHGNVLATSTKNYPTQKIPAAGFPVDLPLKHGGQPSGGYFVTFGYSAMFTASKPPSVGGQGSGGISGNYVFFANEQAVLAR